MEHIVNGLRGNRYLPSHVDFGDNAAAGVLDNGKLVVVASARTGTKQAGTHSRMSYEIQQKWAFGMAPPKPDTSAARHRAARIVVNYLDDGVGDADLPSALSEIKGLFSRVWKQDQWDWFATSRSLGYPATVLCRKVSQELANARKALVDGDEQAEAERRALLRRLPVHVCLRVLLGTSRIADEPGAGWVYLLSRREEPDVLKIGMTTRTVEERVREINGSTGVVYPIGVRSCWRVRTPDVAERLIHEALAASRIRADREFFRMPFAEAASLISSTLRDNALELRTLDNLVAIQAVDNGRKAALDGA